VTDNIMNDYVQILRNLKISG